MGYTRIKNTYNDIAAVNKSIETPDKANAMFIARLNVKIRDDNPDYPALVIGNYMLGGGFLNSRLASRIRQKEGLSYGVGSGFGASSRDESGTFSAYAIYAPETPKNSKSPSKTKSAKRQLKVLPPKKLTKQLKDGFRRSRFRGQTTANWRAESGGHLSADRTIAWEADLESKISQS